MLAGIEQSRAGAYALLSQQPLVDAFLCSSAPPAWRFSILRRDLFLTR
jgi:hypothetical protein